MDQKVEDNGYYLAAYPTTRVQNYKLNSKGEETFSNINRLIFGII